MKRIIKSLFSLLGLTVLKTDTHINSVHFGQLKDLDFYYLLKNFIDVNEDFTLLDVGANEGQSVVKFKKYFPNAAIYSFEPVTKTYDILKAAVAGYSNCYTFKLGIGASDEVKSIKLYDYSQLNTFIPFENNKGTVADRYEDVHITTLDKIISDNNIKKVKLLKSDTEGFEIEVMKGAEGALTNQVFEYIYLEAGFSAKDRRHVEFTVLIQYLRKYNYSFLGMFEVNYSAQFQIDFANLLFVSNERLIKNSREFN